MSILRHKIIDHYRRKKRDSLEDFPDGGEAVTQSAIASEEMVQDTESIRLNPEEILEHQELRSTLRACLDELPERFKQVFVMRDIENESTELICEKLKISVSNFSVMMYHACLQLKDFFLKKAFHRFLKIKTNGLSKKLNLQLTISTVYLFEKYDASSGRQGGIMKLMITCE